MSAYAYDLLAGDELGEGLNVDLFAGGGGASTGIEWATGRIIDLAINHDAEALAMHRANHPGTRHLCANIREVNPRWATGGKPVNVLWGSPDCKHFSRAKGGKPMERAIRSLAWVIVRWAEETLPRIICVENVPEFQTWGPLGPDSRPLAAHKGDYFRAWVRRLRRLGYRVEWNELVAADFGAPTSRKRFFVVARRDGLPIVWPQPTHGPKRAEPWRTAAQCIEWSDPAPSIFDRKKPLAPKTQARIAKGIKRYVLQAARPFIVNQTHGVRLENIDEPLRTVTAAHRGEKALVAPSLIGIDQQGARSANWPANAPLSTIVAKGKHAVVEAVVEEQQAQAVWVAKHFGGVVGQPADKPLGTITAVDHHSAVSASVIKMRGTNVGSPADAPLHTVSAQGQHHGLLCASITEFRTGAVGRAMDEPLSTITAGGNPKRPSTGNTKALLCAHVQRYYSLGGQLSAADAPMPTLTAKARCAISTAHLTQYNGRSEAQPLDEPMPTATGMNKLGLTTFDMAPDAEGRYVLVREFLRRWGVIGPDEEAETLIDGVLCRIVDIGMRMLRPRELYRAQGFPDTYQIAPVHRGKPLTLTSQVRMCGNSVPPHLSYALLSANLADAGENGRPVAEAV